jgi:hypothetical protein
VDGVLGQVSCQRRKELCQVGPAWQWEKEAELRTGSALVVAGPRAKFQAGPEWFPSAFSDFFISFPFFLFLFSFFFSIFCNFDSNQFESSSKLFQDSLQCSKPVINKFSKVKHDFQEKL